MEIADSNAVPTSLQGLGRVSFSRGSMYPFPRLAVHDYLVLPMVTNREEIILNEHAPLTGISPFFKLISSSVCFG